MAHPFDATLKDLVAQSPDDLRKPFRLPDIAPAQSLNVDLSTISAATDVAIGFGDPLQEIVDINFQSGPDPAVASRLHLYNSALHFKFQAPVRSILVLLRPKGGTPGLTGKLSYTCGGKRVLFQYDVIRLWMEPVEAYLEGGAGLLPLAPLCKMPAGKPIEEAVRDVVHEIDRRLRTELDHAHAVRLMTAAYILTGARVPKPRLPKIYEGVRIMHELTAWEEMEQAELKGELRVLLSQGREKFGDPDKKTEAALKAIQDPGRLERMGVAMLKMKSWKALLSVQ
jgi:hypothetical protein